MEEQNDEEEEAWQSKGRGRSRREEHNGSRMRGFLPEASRKRRIKLAKKRDSLAEKEGQEGNLAEVDSNGL